MSAPDPTPTVEVKAWNEREALALVDGLVVRVERRARSVRWRCQACGRQIDRPRCPHARALAATPLPAQPQPDREDTP